MGVVEDVIREPVVEVVDIDGLTDERDVALGFTLNVYVDVLIEI